MIALHEILGVEIPEQDYRSWQHSTARWNWPSIESVSPLQDGSTGIPAWSQRRSRFSHRGFRRRGVDSDAKRGMLLGLLEHLKHPFAVRAEDTVSVGGKTISVKRVTPSRAQPFRSHPAPGA